MGIMTRLVLVALTVLLSSCSEAILANESNGRQIAADYPLTQVDGAAPATVGQVATGQPKLVNKQQVAPFEMVEAEPNCRMPRASSNARVAFVYFYGGGVKTPLQYVADAANAGQMQAQIKRSREFAKQAASSGFQAAALANEAAGFARGNAVEWITRTDVLVTETDAPVFLVLTSYNAVLWNIQTAPGVEIDGIIVSAYEGGAIANGVDARRTGFMGFRGAPNKSCYIKGRGYPLPIEKWIENARAQNPDINIAEHRAGWEQKIREGRKFFNNELPRLIGKRPEWIITHGPNTGTRAILVGDVPAQPFEQQPITKLQLPSYVWPFWGTRSDAYKFFGL